MTRSTTLLVEFIPHWVFECLQMANTEQLLNQTDKNSRQTCSIKNAVLVQFPSSQLSPMLTPGQLPPRTIARRTLPPGQVPPRTIAPWIIPLDNFQGLLYCPQIITPGQLLPGAIAITNYNFFMAMFCFFSMAQLYNFSFLL